MSIEAKSNMSFNLNKEWIKFLDDIEGRAILLADQKRGMGICRVTFNILDCGHIAGPFPFPGMDFNSTYKFIEDEIVSRIQKIGEIDIKVGYSFWYRGYINITF